MRAGMKGLLVTVVLATGVVAAASAAPAPTVVQADWKRTIMAG